VVAGRLSGNNHAPVAPPRFSRLRDHHGIGPRAGLLQRGAACGHYL